MNPRLSLTLMLSVTTLNTGIAGIALYSFSRQANAADLNRQRYQLYAAQTSVIDAILADRQNHKLRQILSVDETLEEAEARLLTALDGLQQSLESLAGLANVGSN